MTHKNDCLESVERELASVKRQYRRLQLLVVAAALTVVVGAWSWGRGSTPPKAPQADTLTTRAIHVVDQSGRARIKMHVLPAGPAIQVFDEDGDVRLALFGGQAGSGIILADTAGRNRAQLATTDSKPSLTFLDQAGQQRLSTALWDAGPRISLRDSNGTVRLQAGTGSTTSASGATTIYPASSIRLADTAGNVIWSAPQ